MLCLPRHPCCQLTGADRQRKRLLKTVSIVGVTCCSSLLAALDGQQFDVVILDESSQMVEPLSAVPLLRARARCAAAAVAAGAHERVQAAVELCIVQPAAVSR
jgi:hypothetical protein